MRENRLLVNTDKGLMYGSKEPGEQILEYLGGKHKAESHLQSEAAGWLLTLYVAVRNSKGGQVKEDGVWVLNISLWPHSEV